MMEPDHHPHADDLADFLVAGFGPHAPHVLVALQSLLANEPVMQFIDAFCFVHESPDDDSDRVMNRREGMRKVALHIHAARSLSEHDLRKRVNSEGDTT